MLVFMFSLLKLAQQWIPLAHIFLSRILNWFSEAELLQRAQTLSTLTYVKSIYRKDTQQNFIQQNFHLYWQYIKEHLVALLILFSTLNILTIYKFTCLIIKAILFIHVIFHLPIFPFVSHPFYDLCPLLIGITFLTCKNHLCINIITFHH